MSWRANIFAWLWVDADTLSRLMTPLLFAGAGLRIAQYALGEVLWYDELALARNLVEKPLRALLTMPLDYAQVAPPGFLLIVKGVMAALGNNEYALRLFPLLCALASLPLFAAVARRILPPCGALLAVVLFGLSPALIGFGSQTKQYSTDVAVALALTALTLRWWERRRDDGAAAAAAFLGAVGFAAVWFSYTAVLVVAGLGAALLIEYAWSREAAGLRSLVPIFVLWGIGALGAITLALRSTNPATQAYMQAYWAGGFMPLPPRSGEEAMWLWRAILGLFQREVLYPRPGVAVFVMALGALVLLKRCRWSALAIGMPIGVAFLASAAHQYPVGERVSLFLLPGILLLVAEGADRLRRTLAAVWRPLGAAVMAIAILTAAHTLYAHFPLYPDQDVRDVFAHVQARRQPGDAVYVFYNAEHATVYYGPRYDLRPQGTDVGLCPGGDTRRLLHELDRYRGRGRLWVVISHAVGPFREREAILGYLAAIGTERDRIVVGSPRLGSSAYLFDLSDSEKLKTVEAHAYSLPEREPGIREFPCAPPTRDQSLSMTLG